MFFYLTRYLLLKIGEVCLVLFQLFFLLVMFSKKLDLFSCCLEHLMQLLIVFQGEANLDLCFLKSLLLAYRISLLLSKVSQLGGSYWPYKKANYHIQLATVKPVLTNTFLKRPPVLNDHVVVFPQVLKSNFSLCSDHLYNATSDHSNDIPGFYYLHITTTAQRAYSRSHKKFSRRFHFKVIYMLFYHNTVFVPNKNTG